MEWLDILTEIVINVHELKQSEVIKFILNRDNIKKKENVSLKTLIDKLKWHYWNKDMAQTCNPSNLGDWGKRVTNSKTV